tara:strand:+ start:4207 stop:4941 length:735 start_codon:yes stop_codon:yes gene_type:complete
MATTGLILTIGKSTEHVKTSIQYYNPDYMILLTSEEYASTTRRKLSHWKKQYDLDGDVAVIKGLFTDESAENIMTESLRAIDVLRSVEMEYIFMGITGGTMHMAAAASSAATIAGVPIFYVKQPDGEQVVQPNKDVIEMSTLGAYTRLSKLPAEALDLFRSVFTLKEDDEKGKISASEAANIGMPQGFLDYLTRQRVLEKTDESNYVFTYSGFSMVRMLHDNPNIAKLIENQNEKVDEPDHMFG